MRRCWPISAARSACWPGAGSPTGWASGAGTCSGPASLATVGLVIAGMTMGTWWSLAGMCVATAGFYGTKGPFWSMPSMLLTGTAAAAGIAWINSIGNVGGAVGPALVGWIKDFTGSYSGGLYGLAVFTAISALIAAFALHIPRQVPVRGGVERAGRVGRTCSLSSRATADNVGAVSPRSPRCDRHSSMRPPRDHGPGVTPPSPRRTARRSARWISIDSTSYRWALTPVFRVVGHGALLDRVRTRGWHVSPTLSRIPPTSWQPTRKARMPP